MSWLGILVSEWIEGFRSINAAIRFRFNYYNWYDWHLDFWSEINYGWYSMYIWPYDDIYNCHVSKERQLRLGEKPREKWDSERDKELITVLLSLPKNESVNIGMT